MKGTLECHFLWKDEDVLHFGREVSGRSKRIIYWFYAWGKYLKFPSPKSGTSMAPPRMSVRLDPYFKTLSFLVLKKQGPEFVLKFEKAIHKAPLAQVVPLKNSTGHFACVGTITDNSIPYLSQPSRFSKNIHSSRETIKAAQNAHQNDQEDPRQDYPTPQPVFIE
ncbi:hypothetical protein SDJN02_04585, partial [Cucurbita argyrosperma subsp. argyrosperma]